MTHCFNFIITVRNEVAKVMFLQASACPGGGGVGGEVCLSACWDTTPPEQTPPGSRHPPREQTPPWSRHPPRADTPPKSRHPQSRHPQSRHTHPREQTPPPPGADTAPRGADTPLPGSRPPGADSPPPRYSHCCGRYASYWNAFLFLAKLTSRLAYEQSCLSLTRL